MRGTPELGRKLGIGWWMLWAFKKSLGIVLVPPTDGRDSDIDAASDKQISTSIISHWNTYRQQAESKISNCKNFS